MLKSRISWGAVVAAIAIAVAPLASPASAQIATGAWTKVCGPDPADPTGRREACSVVYQIVSDNGQFIAQASLNQVAGAPEILMSVWVRTGVFVNPGVGVRVDQAQPAGIPFVLCDPNICIAETNVDAAFITSLKRGGKLTISTFVPDATAGGARQLDFEMTLVGFTATYDGPGLNGAEAQALQDRILRDLQDRADAARQRLIDQQRAAAPAP